MRLGPRARCSIRSTSDSSLLAGPQARYKGKTNAGPSAMANDTLINLLACCKRERERLQMQRELLQSGRFRIFEKVVHYQKIYLSTRVFTKMEAYKSEFYINIMGDCQATRVGQLPPVGESSAPHRTAVCRLVLKRATR